MGAREQAGAWRRGVAAVWHHGRAHRRWLLAGAAAGVAVTGLRLLLPWSLHHAVSPYVSQPGGAHHDELMSGGLAFVLAALGLGLADHLERLWFAKFSIGAVGDLREHAARASMGADAHPGQRVARLVGDAARLKAGLKGVLVHVVTGSVLLVALFAMLFWLDTRVGLVFGAGVVALLALTLVFARRIALRAKKHRVREGHVAEELSDGRLPDRLLRGGRTGEARLTRETGRATWGAYAIYAAAVVGMLFVAVGTDALLLVVLYGLMARGPIVRLVRQGCRVGKLHASLERLSALAPPREDMKVVPELAS